MAQEKPNMEQKEIRFYSERNTVTIPFFLRDRETGEPIYKKHSNTGEKIYHSNGEKVRENQALVFSSLSVAKGATPASCFILEANSDQYQAKLEAITRAMNEPGNKIFSEAEWEKRKNPAAFEERRLLKEIDTKYGQQSAQLREAQEEIARLKQNNRGR